MQTSLKVTSGKNTAIVSSLSLLPERARPVKAVKVGTSRIQFVTRTATSLKRNG